MSGRDAHVDAQGGARAKRVRLTDAQYRLFMEMKSSGGLYITRWKRYARTAEALAHKGLVRIDVPDNSRLGQDHYALTEEGWAWTDPTL